MKSKITLLFSIILFSQFSLAGVWNLTHTSRANCGNNESISWDLRTLRNLAATSVHYNVEGNFSNWESSPQHSVSTTAPSSTHRAAAVHWGESAPLLKQWYVKGHHWERVSSRRTIYRATEAKDCNLSEGWW